MAKEIKSKTRYRQSAKGKVMERRKYLKKAYGITLEQYNEMYAEQGGRCRICLKHEIAKNQYGMKQLSVDHDHKTGKVRALLCLRCNMALGYVDDDPGLLIEAARYLMQHQ